MSFWSRISSSIGAPSTAPKASPPADESVVAVLEEISGEVAEASRLVKERLEYLFRDGTRHGAINPLLYVVTRYRAQQK